MNGNQLVLGLLTVILVLGAMAAPARAEVVTRSIAYTDGDTQLEGYYAYDDAIAGQRPAVLIVHAWWGLGPDEKSRAEKLARLGYAAFALDMYGTGKFTSDPAQAGEWSGGFYRDREMARTRAAAGLKVLTSQAEVDKNRVAAIGYCFGGTIVIELGYSGADLRGIVAFHGNPLPATAGDAARVKAHLLICHGAADSLVPMEKVRAFTDSLAEASIDWELIVYAHAKHSFTTPSADKLGMAGVGYNEIADRRSWAAMQAFFNEIFDR